jgi:hypothetical protein
MKREERKNSPVVRPAGEDADKIAERINEKLRSLRSSIQPCAGPAMAECNAYDIRIVWVAKSDACIECRALADGSPYRHGALKIWPGLTSCGSLCRCHITAFQPDWDAAFNGHSNPEERQLRA